MTTPKIAFVTGGASGIGLAVGRLLAARGLQVILADVDAERLDQVLAGFGAGERVETVRLDVTDADAVDAAVSGAAARHGGLDYLFNNAGVGGTKDLREATLVQWRRIVDLNIMGMVHGVMAAYPIMVRQGRGHIVNTSSISGLMPWPGQTLYNTTKYAIVGLSHTLRQEAARFGVKVSVVCPGPVKSAIWHTSILGERGPDRPSPEEAMSAEMAAEIIWRGVEANRETIIFPRVLVLLNWLYRLHPGFLKARFDQQLHHLLPP